MTDLTVWSIGHSKHAIEDFHALLALAKIKVLVDVRSSPFSQMAPQFNRPQLKQSLKAKELRYIYMGDTLGGRPNSDEMYDDKNHVFYDLVAQTNVFKEGVEQLRAGIAQYRVAIMCSEGSPAKCHRTLLVARVLQLQGIKVINVLPDGVLEEQEDLNQLYPQQPLFGIEEVKSWRSAVSVRQESQHDNSLSY